MSADYLVIANLFLLLFLGLADNQMIAALLPAFVKSLHVSIQEAGLMVVVYSVGAALASFVSGALSDFWGRRRFLQGGMALFAAASGLAWQSASFKGLIAARAVTGLAAGTLSTCTIAFAGDWFAYEVRGRAIGLITSAYFVAPVAGVPAAAFIADRFGWRRTFLAIAAAAVVAAFASLTLPRETPKVHTDAPRWRATLGTFRGFFARRDTSAALGIAFMVSGGLVGFITYIGQWLNAGFALSTTTIGLIFAYGGAMAVAGHGAGCLGFAIFGLGGRAACRFRRGQPCRGVSPGAAYGAHDRNGSGGRAGHFYRLAQYLLATRNRRHRFRRRHPLREVRLWRGYLAVRCHDRTRRRAPVHSHHRAAAEPRVT